MAGVEGVSAEKKIAGQAGNDAESQAGNDAMDKSRREVARLRPGIMLEMSGVSTAALSEYGSYLLKVLQHFQQR